MIYLTVAKNFVRIFIFRKRGIMKLILENCFCLGEKVKDGGFYFSKKKQAFFCWSAGI